jgi:hypothetical protein
VNVETQRRKKMLKKVDKKKNPGLSKLPKKVRNKMGYMKDGGRVKKATGGMVNYGKNGKITMLFLMLQELKLKVLVLLDLMLKILEKHR